MSFKAALIQMRSSRDMAVNLVDASTLIKQASSQGAEFISTPEMTNIFESDRERLKAVAMTEAEDPSVRGFSEYYSVLQIASLTSRIRLGDSSEMRIVAHSSGRIT